MSLLKVSEQQGIVTVSLNRPDKRNAMSFALLNELIETAKKIKKNRNVRCVILTGEAHVFSAGIDLSDLNSPKNSIYAAWELLKPGQSLFQKACLIWQSLPVPIIAVLEGYCFGAGMQLALAADIRISHSDTQFSIMESRWGLVPDMGLTQSLKGLIAIDLAKELTFSGRIFSADYAKDIGLITYIDENPMQYAITLTEEFNQRSPDALVAAKHVLNAMIEQPDKSLRFEKLWQLKLLLGKNSRLARKKDRENKTNFLPRQYK